MPSPFFVWTNVTWRKQEKKIFIFSDSSTELLSSPGNGTHWVCATVIARLCSVVSLTCSSRWFQAYDFFRDLSSHSFVKLRKASKGRTQISDCGGVEHMGWIIVSKYKDFPFLLSSPLTCEETVGSWGLLRLTDSGEGICVYSFLSPAGVWAEAWGWSTASGSEQKTVTRKKMFHCLPTNKKQENCTAWAAML